MYDDPTERGPMDPRRINIYDEHEASYWSQKFGCTRGQLEQAVRAVGVLAGRVEDRLKR